MAAEYPLVNFGDICEHSAFGPRFSSKEYASDGNVACLRTMDMDFSGRINFDAMPLAKLDLVRLRNHILQRDDLVITRTGAYLGKAAVFTQFRLPVVAGAFSIYFRLNREIAEPTFVRNFFNSSVGQEATKSIATGSAQPNLNIPLLHSLQIPLPPLPTQRKIASILSAYDDLIENNTRRIAILEEMAQAIYREWFVNFRFPGHENVKLVDSPLGQIPEGWEVTTLGDCLSVLETGNRPKGGISGFSEGVVSIGAESIIGAGQFEFSKTRFIPPEYFEKMKRGIVADRDVLVYKDGGKPGYFIPHVSFFGNGFPYQVMALNSHVYRLRGNDDVSQEYLYYHLSSEEMLHWMHLNGSGAAIPSIARKDLVRLPVILPPPELLETFTEIAADNLSQILTVARKSQNLRTTRDLLLPKLISGKLDVEDLDIDVGEPLEELAEVSG